MSVLKAYRNLSSLEFFVNAIHLRHELTQWLLKDFGNNRKYKKVAKAFPDITDEDLAKIQEIADKYNESENKIFKSLYPEWFADFERNYILEILRDMLANIVSANTIYVTSEMEYNRRRDYQNQAIADCYKIYQELQYITHLFPSDLNYLTTILDKTEREIELLKGWRKSDNKLKKNISG